MVAKLSGVQSGTTLSKKKKKRKFVHPLQSCRSRAMTAQKCSKWCDARAMHVQSCCKPIAFFFRVAVAVVVA